MGKKEYSQLKIIILYLIREQKDFFIGPYRGFGMCNLDEYNGVNEWILPWRIAICMRGEIFAHVSFDSGTRYLKVMLVKIRLGGLSRCLALTVFVVGLPFLVF